MELMEQISETEVRMPNGNVYITHKCLGYSDYSGCMVERSNVAVISVQGFSQEMYSYSDFNGKEYLTLPDPEKYGHIWEPIDATEQIVKLYGGYGSTQLWIRADVEEEHGFIAALSSYPVLDDELLSQMEAEAEEEAWDSWVARDAYKTLPEWLQELADQVDDRGLRRTFLIAADEAGVYGEIEVGGGYWIDVEEVPYAEALMAHLEVEVCPECGGSKEDEEGEVCPECDGEGYLPKDKSGLIQLELPLAA